MHKQTGISARFESQPSHTAPKMYREMCKTLSIQKRVVFVHPLKPKSIWPMIVII